MQRLEAIVIQLGGQVLKGNTYLSKATDCIFQEDPAKAKLHDPDYIPPMPFMVIGCLASEKPVLTPEYLHSSFAAGTFLKNQGDFLPNSTRFARAYVNEKRGLMFRNMNISVIMQDQKKKQEIETVLMDGGARLHGYTLEQLTTVSPVEAKKLDVILTDYPSYSNDFKLKTFIATSRRAGWSIEFFHYYWLMRYSIDPRPCSRPALNVFRIESPMMHHLKGNNKRSISKHEYPAAKRHLSSVNVTNESHSTCSSPAQRNRKSSSAASNHFSKLVAPVFVDLASDDETEVKVEGLPGTSDKPAVRDAKPNVSDVVIDLVSEGEEDEDVTVVQQAVVKPSIIWYRQPSFEIVEISSDSDCEIVIESDSEDEIIEVYFSPAPTSGKKSVIVKQESNYEEVTMEQQVNDISVSKTSENEDESRTPSDDRLAKKNIEEQPVQQTSATIISVPPTTINEKLIRKVIHGLQRRERDTGECIDIENLICRTFRVDKRKDFRKGNKSKVIEQMATDMLMKYMEIDEAMNDKHVTSEIIETLRSFSSLISSTSYPQARDLNGIFHKYCQMGNPVLSNLCYDVLRKVLTFFLPVNKSFRQYYLKIFDKHAFKSNGEESSEHDFKKDFPSFFLDLFKRAAVNPSDDGARLQLDFVITVLKADLEYWWKHDGNEVEKTLAMNLLYSDSYLDHFAMKLCDHFKLVLEKKDKNFAPMVDNFFRAIAILAMLCACRDKDRKLTSLKVKTTLKLKLGLQLNKFFKETEFRSKGEMVMLLRLLRPKWLALLVSKADEIQDGPLQSLSDPEKQTQDTDIPLLNLRLEKRFATYHYHTLLATLLSEQNDSIKNPYKGMTKALRPAKEEKSKTKNPKVTFDSKISINLGEITQRLNEIFLAVKENVTSVPEDKLCNLFRKCIL